MNKAWNYSVFLLLVFFTLQKHARAQATNVINTTGNVGVGVLTPTTTLQVLRNEQTYRTAYTDIFTVSAKAGTLPYNGHGGGILLNGSNYNSNNTLVNYARIGSTINSNSVDTYGSDLFFDIAPLSDGNLNRAMTIKYNGKTGLGIADPASMFHIQNVDKVNRTTYSDILTLSARSNLLPYNGYGAAILFNGSNYQNNDALANFARIGTTINSNSIDTYGSDLFFDVATNSAGSMLRAMTIKYSGDIGVGISDPLSKFNINVANESTVPAAGSATKGFSLLGGSNGYGLISGVIADGTVYMQSQRVDGTPTVYNMLLNPNGGNIGIGVSEPLSKFNIHVSNESAVPAAGSATKGFSLLGGSNGYGLISGVIADGTVYMQSQRVDGNPSVYNMLLNPNGGNIRIGTSAPHEKLSVDGNITANGTVFAKKIKVTQTEWSDYVFDKDYKLRTLSSVEKFIKQNNHLPDVPSAKQVQKEGISVGDNQALLLRKIE
jgi:hypothetical protein